MKKFMDNNIKNCRRGWFTPALWNRRGTGLGLGQPTTISTKSILYFYSITPTFVASVFVVQMMNAHRFS